MGLRVSRIDTMLVDRCPENPNWAPVLCRVFADDGTYGDGEAAVAFACGARASFGALQDIAGLALGQDPLDIPAVWERVYNESFWCLNGGLAHMAALSAIDMALWDLKGKACGKSVAELLGGARRCDLPAYASQLQNGWGTGRQAARSPEDYARNALKAVDQGYETVKIDFLAHRPGAGHYEFVETGRPSAEVLDVFRERIEAVREAVGPKVGIAVEGHAVLDAVGAVAVGRISQEYDALFFEEPTASYVGDIRAVREAVDVPIALGERLYSCGQYLPFLEEGLVQIVQPDAGTVGGISELVRVSRLAQRFGSAVMPHDCGTPVLNAATLHIEASLPEETLHEHHVNNLHEYNRRLATRSFEPCDGRICVPEGPGLGTEISDYALAHARHVVIE